MRTKNQVDIKENSIIEIEPRLLDILLFDQSSKRNIIWATENYEKYGACYSFDNEITIGLITGENGEIIKPRIRKSKEEQNYRAKKNAEVFTPAWVCNIQNNQVDNLWFGRKNVFNKETMTTWKAVKSKIKFDITGNKTWESYVDDLRLEISCGEAPYLVNRYDVVTGKIIDPMQRIGMLDRKLRVVSENTESEECWIEYAERAFKSVYAYEWQGDSLLIARENLLFSFIDFFEMKFLRKPSYEQLFKIAHIISWNIWQMDGMKGVVPNSCHKVVRENSQLCMFKQDFVEEECPGCLHHDNNLHNGQYVQIMDWKSNTPIKYLDVLKGE